MPIKPEDLDITQLSNGERVARFGRFHDVEHVTEMQDLGAQINEEQLDQLIADCRAAAESAKKLITIFSLQKVMMKLGMPIPDAAELGMVHKKHAEQKLPLLNKTEMEREISKLLGPGTRFIEGN